MEIKQHVEQQHLSRFTSSYIGFIIYTFHAWRPLRQASFGHHSDTSVVLVLDVLRTFTAVKPQ